MTQKNVENGSKDKKSWSGQGLNLKGESMKSEKLESKLLLQHSDTICRFLPEIY